MAELESRDRSLAGAVVKVCLAGALWWFVGASMSDAAYSASYEIQWTNFASWLLTGALVLSAVAVIASVVTLASGRRDRVAVLYAAVLAVAWLTGLWSALVHARDAWASMPTGYVLSVVATVLTAVATWLAFRRAGAGDVR